MTAAPDQLRDADPLLVARNWIRRAHAIAEEVAEHERREPGFGTLHAEITGAGPRQFDATQRAAYIALVSIAGDVRRIADALDPPGPPRPVMPPRDEDRSGSAIAEAEARWSAAEGADD